MAIEKITRLARFAFYLGLGGWAAFVSACAESTDGHRHDAASPLADSGKDSSFEAGQGVVDAGGLGGESGDAGISDAARDGNRPDGASRPDSATGATDSGKGGAMWDVIYE